MWIRSQDKTGLIKVEEFTLYKANSHLESELLEMLNVEICWVIKGKYANVLGAYSTKEKALKVLDMIEEQIDQQEEFKAQGEERPNNTSYRRLMKFVFQMPQDSEV